MKIQFLGTAAAEGVPAVFCNCEYCNTARELKGKNIRTRHQTIINDDLLIDLPADTFYHALTHQIRLDKVKYLVVTHAHCDHFYPQELMMKIKPYAHNQYSLTLDVYGGKSTEKLFLREFENFDVDGFKNKVVFHLTEYYKPFKAGDYTITPLPARHDTGNDARFYIIEYKNKKILYAHDTGIFFDEVYNYLEKLNVVFDFISLDCTNGRLEWPDEQSHMGFCQIEKLIKKLYDIKVVNADTVKYINHFSHNGNPIHEDLESWASKHGFRVAFDGETVNI